MKTFFFGKNVKDVPWNSVATQHEFGMHPNKIIAKANSFMLSERIMSLFCHVQEQKHCSMYSEYVC
jgi:hypothetical protein